MLTLLQLSDLHFGKDHFFQESRGRNSLAEAIRAALDDANVKPDHVVFSGDFFSKDQGNDLPLAEAGIRAIAHELSLPPEALWFVPGNHDLSWSGQHADKKFYFYDDLVNKISKNSVCAKDSLPTVEWLNKSQVEANPQIRPVFLALLDSCIVEGKYLAGIGEIGETQLRTFKNKLNRLKAEWASMAATTSSDYTLIVAFHHHLLPVHQFEDLSEDEYTAAGLAPDVPYFAYKARSSHTLDAVDILNELADQGAALLIHGHQHKSAIVSYQNKLQSKPVLNIAAAGTCASKEADTREFFIHEISEHEICIKRFIQDGLARRFRFDREIRLQLPHISSLSTIYCVEEARHRHDRTVLGPPPSSGDQSNLNIIFASVASCSESRKIIRKFLDTDEGLREKNSLEGMYDLLGHWDLAVRFRLNDEQDFETSKTALSELLKASDQMTDSGVFGNGVYLNVVKESDSFANLLPSSQVNTGGRNRTIFANSDEYDNRRCQRGFLFIFLPAEVRMQNQLIQSLSNLLDEDDRFRAVAEGIYKCSYTERGDPEVGTRSALVIETFMSCAQSVSLNHINRRIEGKLSEFNLQKYTMLCYAYDEDELLAYAA